MSGGVDSSVAAYLLKEGGFEVEGLSFVLWEARNRRDFTTCCSLEAIGDAATIADSLSIKHSQLDVRNLFIEKVIEPFVESYVKGMTPNPCVLCNRYIKFPFLLNEAKERGFDYIATGHYARVMSDKRQSFPSLSAGETDAVLSHRPLLLRGVAPKKDQSYFLYVLLQEQLERLILPLGHFSKDEVRKIARKRGLFIADKPESQEICFIEDNNYFKFISKLSPIAHEEGSIVNESGKVIGTHKGIFAYTIGQRKGIGVSSPDPLFVYKIDYVKNTIHVGHRELAMSDAVTVNDLNWIVPRSDKSFRAGVKVRSTMGGENAMVVVEDDRVEVAFDKPIWAPAPGQSAVFYDGDAVMGGGVISGYQ